MRPPPFILVLKSNAPKRARNPAPGGVLSLNADGLNRRDSCIMAVPDSRRPTRGPTLSKHPRQGHHLHPRPETGTRGRYGRHMGVLLLNCPVLEHAGYSRRKVGAGHARKGAGCRLRQARCSACPTQGWVKPSSKTRLSATGSSSIIETDFPSEPRGPFLFYPSQIELDLLKNVNISNRQAHFRLDSAIIP